MQRAETLTSSSNPLLKDVRRAISRGGLTRDGYMVAESFHLVEEALRSGLEIRAVLAAESVQSQLRVHGRRLLVVDDATFQKMSSTESSQGVMALVRPPEWTLKDVMRGHTLAVVLDGLQDPGNAGAVARAAEAFGATGVVFSKGTVSPFNPKTLRAAAGSLFRIPFAHNVDVSAARAALDEHQAVVYTAMPHGGKPLPETDLRRRCAVVIGSEAHGVSDAWRMGASAVSIPSVGVESLNAAVAAGILLYEAQGQRTRS